MATFETIARIGAYLFVAGIIVFGIAAVYLNVFEPWKNKRKSRKAWDIHAK